MTSNLYKLSLQGNLFVHQYNLEVTPDELWEADKVLRVLQYKWRQIEATIGPFVPAGKTILALTELSESVEFDFSYRGDKVKIKIPQETGQGFFFDDEFCNKNNDVKQMIFNLIINQAFRETNLK